MNNQILSKIYSNIATCEICSQRQVGILLDGGLIRLPCGCEHCIPAELKKVAS